MAINSRDLPATPPSDVWDVLADGWLYPLWVVGASRMREVDGDWPAPGACLHHSVGTWPILLDDVTEVTALVPGSSLSLRPKARPTGTVEVVIRIEPVGAGCRVVIEEDVVTGPARLVPKFLRDPALHWRNTETLRRLALVAERRSARTTSESLA